MYTCSNHTIKVLLYICHTITIIPYLTPFSITDKLKSIYLSFLQLTSGCNPRPTPRYRPMLWWAATMKTVP